MLNAAQLHQALLKLLPIRDEQYAERDDLFEKMVVEERLSSKVGSVDMMGIDAEHLGSLLCSVSGITKKNMMPEHAIDISSIIRDCALHVAQHHSVYKDDASRSEELIRRSDLRLLLLHVERYYAVLGAFDGVQHPEDPLCEAVALSVELFTRRFDASVRSHLGIANWPAAPTAALLRYVSSEKQLTSPKSENSNVSQGATTSLTLHDFAMWASNMSLEREQRLGEDAAATAEPTTPDPKQEGDGDQSDNPLIPPAAAVQEREPTEDELLAGAAVMELNDAAADVLNRANMWTMSARPLLPVDDERTVERLALLKLMTNGSSRQHGSLESLLNVEGGADLFRKTCSACNINPGSLFVDAAHAVLVGEVAQQHVLHHFGGKLGIPDSFLLRCYLYAIANLTASYLDLLVLVASQLRHSVEVAYEDYRLRYREWKRRQIKLSHERNRHQSTTPRGSLGGENSAPPRPPPSLGVSVGDVCDAVAGLGQFLNEESEEEWLRASHRDVSIEEWRVSATSHNTSRSSPVVPVILPSPLPVFPRISSTDEVTLAVGLHYVCYLTLRPLFPLSLVWREAEALMTVMDKPSAGESNNKSAVWKAIITPPGRLSLLSSPRCAVEAAPGLWRRILDKHDAKTGARDSSTPPLVLMDTVLGVFQDGPAAACLTQSLRAIGLGNVFQRAFGKAMCIAGGKQFPDPALTSEIECDLFARVLHSMLDGMFKVSDVIHVYWDDLSNRTALQQQRLYVTRKVSNNNATSPQSPAPLRPSSSNDGSSSDFTGGQPCDVTSPTSAAASSSDATGALSRASLPLTRQMRPESLILGATTPPGSSAAKNSHVDVALRILEEVFPSNPLLAAENSQPPSSSIEQADGWRIRSALEGQSLEDALHYLSAAEGCSAAQGAPGSQWRSLFQERIPERDTAADERKRYLLWRELQMRQLQSNSGSNRPSSGRDFNKINPLDFLRYVHGRLPLVQLIVSRDGRGSSISLQAHSEQIIRDALSHTSTASHTPKRESSAGTAASSPMPALPPRPSALMISKDNVHDVFLYVATYLHIALNSRLEAAQSSVTEVLALELLTEVGVADPSSIVANLDRAADGMYALDSLAAGAAAGRVAQRHFKKKSGSAAPTSMSVELAATSNESPDGKGGPCAQARAGLFAVRRRLSEVWLSIVKDEGFPIQAERKLVSEEAACRRAFSECAAMVALPSDGEVATNGESLTDAAALPIVAGSSLSRGGSGGKPTDRTSQVVLPLKQQDVIDYFKGRWPALSSLADAALLDRVLRAGFALGLTSSGAFTTALEEPVVSPHQFRLAASFMFNFMEVASVAEGIVVQQGQADDESDEGENTHAPFATSFSDVWLSKEQMLAVIAKFDLLECASEDLFEILVSSCPPPPTTADAGSTSAASEQAGLAVNAAVVAMWAAKVLDVRYQVSGVVQSAKASTRWLDLRRTLHLGTSEDDRQARLQMFEQADVAHRNGLSLAELERFLIETVGGDRFMVQLRPVLFRAYEATMEHRRLVLGDGGDEPLRSESTTSPGRRNISASSMALKHPDRITYDQFRHFLYYVYEYACLYYMFDVLIAATEESSRTKVLPRAVFVKSMTTLRSWGYQGSGSKEALERAFIRLGGGAEGGADAAVFNEFAEWASDEGLRVDA